MTKRIVIAGPTEAAVQRACIQLLGQLEIPVYRVGQRNAHGTQDPGVSDLIVLSRRHGIVFVEVKKPGGVQSPAQQIFERDVRDAGGRYELVRSSEALARLLGPTAGR